MQHMVKLLERRFPQHAHRIMPALVLASLLVLLPGLSLYAGR